MINDYVLDINYTDIETNNMNKALDYALSNIKNYISNITNQPNIEIALEKEVKNINNIQDTIIQNKLTNITIEYSKADKENMTWEELDELGLEY